MLDEAYGYRTGEGEDGMRTKSLVVWTGTRLTPSERRDLERLVDERGITVAQMLRHLLRREMRRLKRDAISSGDNDAEFL